MRTPLMRAIEPFHANSALDRLDHSDDPTICEPLETDLKDMKPTSEHAA